MQTISFSSVHISINQVSQNKLLQAHFNFFFFKDKLLSRVK